MHMMATEHFALYLRYQTTHERAFYKALNELQKLRNERRKEQIGFESQKRAQAAEIRAEKALNLRIQEFQIKKLRFERSQKPVPFRPNRAPATKKWPPNHLENRTAGQAPHPKCAHTALARQHRTGRPTIEHIPAGAYLEQSIKSST